MGLADAFGKVCVLGLGRTGIAVAEWLAARIGAGVDEVVLYGGATSEPGEATQQLENNGVRVVCGTEEVRGTYDLAVVSPGIPPYSDFFVSAAACAREVVGEPELAWRASPERWCAITGTNGKTTTTLLTRALLAAGGLETTAVGNVGTVALGEVDGRVPDSWFVAELSSFQLATTRLLHPHMACLLNITPDHLEWHGTMDAYAEAKERVFARMDEHDLAVVSLEDDRCRAAAARLRGRGLRVCGLSVHSEPEGPCAAFVRDGMLVVRLDGQEVELVRAQSLALPGEHNVQNALAASAMAIEAGVSPDAVSHALLAFLPLEHRIEPCGEAGGVRYVNDSKATNTDSVEKALTAFVPGRVVVLLGGHDKGTDLTSLAHVVSARCSAAVCYGEAGPRIAEALLRADAGMGLVVREAPHMAQALELARQLARPSDTVLLSPACSSFDEFSSYARRGAEFKRLVARIVEAEEAR